MFTWRLLQRLFSFLTFLFEANRQDAHLARRLLQHTDFKFYLTGSRFFGTHRRSSDWDLFVQHSYWAISYLESIGFQPRLPELMDELMSKYVGDPQICDVYELGKVQVQIVQDAELKCLAQEYLKSTPRGGLFWVDLRNRDKRQMRGWWKHGYYEAQMDRLHDQVDRV